MTFAEFKLALKAHTHPAGLPFNLEVAYDRLVVEALIHCQKYVRCLQEHNTDIYEYCNTYLSCGTTVVSAPQGRIRRVYTVAGDYCNPVEYRQMSYDALMCEARKVKYTIDPPSALAYGLPEPFYLYFADADKYCGRSNYGFYAIHNRRIYAAPFMDSLERLVIDWDGIKRTWGANDTTSDDPEVFRCVRLYVTKEIALHFERDDIIYAGSTREFQEALADLIHECNEETRIRENELCTDINPDCSSGCST